MPKASRKRIRGHEPTVRPSHRQYAVQDNQVERVEVGSAKESSAPEILESMLSEPSNVAQSRNILTKKAKQTLKHEIFLERLQASRSPYSKSHTRRLKRKAKEQIGGGLSDIQAAITEMEGDIPQVVQESSRQTAGSEANTPRVAANEPRIKSNPGLIGEGKGTPLTKTQRKKALQLEKKRYPMVLENPAFSANPFETIRTHAQNTLLKHQIPPT